MLDPDTIVLTPDGALSGNDVVLYGRFAALVRDYRDLYDYMLDNGIVPPSLPQALTVEEKFRVMYPQASIAAIAQVLFASSEPVHRTVMAQAAGLSEKSLGVTLNRARTVHGLGVNCMASRHHMIGGVRSSLDTFYTLSAHTRQEINAVLSHKAVAYDDNTEIIDAVLTVMSRPEHRGASGITVDDIARLSEFVLASIPLRVYYLVLHKMNIMGLVRRIPRKHLVYTITNNGTIRKHASQQEEGNRPCKT